VRISRLQLKNVRRHADLDLQLAPGLTVVRGPNEAGKSTIQRALELAITRRATSTAAELEAAGSTAEAAEARDALRLGRLLLGGHEVTL